MNGWDKIAKGVVLTVAFSAAGKALAQNFTKNDELLADKVKKEIKFTAPDINMQDMAQFEIKGNDEVASEILKPKAIQPRRTPDTLNNPRITDMNLDMPGNEIGHMYLYMGMLNGKERVFAARFVDGKDNAWAVNLDMNPELISRITQAVDNNNDATVISLGSLIKEDQKRAGITDSREVINRFEAHCTVNDNNRFGLSYRDQRKLDEWSPKDGSKPTLSLENVR